MGNYTHNYPINTNMWLLNYYSSIKNCAKLSHKNLHISIDFSSI